ncbi:MAG TPA: hypothetical protein VGP57_19690 [Actinoplanes sp.]|nr:hypothetical protein [Actinoplanes sp.]
MSTRLRRKSARRPRAFTPFDPAPDIERWQLAAQFRDEWLGHARTARPADRSAAEAAITDLYADVGRPAPDFVWVPSPAAARHLLPRSRLRLSIHDGPPVTGPWRLRTQLANRLSALRHALDARTGRRHDASWSFTRPPAAVSERDPIEALRAGVSLTHLFHTGVTEVVRRSVRDGLGTPLRAAGDHGTMDLTFYGQHEAHWIAPYDIRRRTGLATYRPDDARRLDTWAWIARSAGWWWADEGRCVISERPVTVHTEPVPGTQHGEFRLHGEHGMAVEYADGWGVHAWHGMPVPAWVVHEPTVEHIRAEPNIEVRRCAVERIGWETYLDQAALELVATAPDPGNPGSLLRLYDAPLEVWGRPSRVLLAVNGSAERDGTRRRYGLTVPGNFDDPVAAAGWSYGLTGDQYRQLLRRT